MPRVESSGPDEKYDLSPWMSATSSSRVEQYRYDHANQKLQVTWANHKNNGYIYNDVSYEDYRSFARFSSKGRRINNPLNNHDYYPMENAEWTIPSNPQRTGLTSRVRE